MAKKRRKPNLKNPNSKTWKKKADDEWKKIVKSSGACAVCGTTTNQLHAHHLIGRTNLKYRHEPMNGVCLCATHHSMGGYKVDICCHGDLGQVHNFEAWLHNNRTFKWDWWIDHRDDKRQREETYEQAYLRLTELSG